MTAADPSTLAPPASYQVTSSGSLSTSHDPDPSSTTVALRPSGAITSRLVWPNEATNNGDNRAAAIGASLTGLTVMRISAGWDSNWPSLALKLKLSGPL